MSTHTAGEWNFACDSYGKVRHSKKACVYTHVAEPRGDRIVSIAARIPNWEDAKLIAAAPQLLNALKGFLAVDWTKPQDANGFMQTLANQACKAVALAEGK